MYYKLFFIGFIFLWFIGCSKTTVVLLESGKSQNTILVSNQTAETKIDRIGSYVELKKKGQSEVKRMSNEEVSNRFANVLAATPLKPLSYILYFENATTLTEASKHQLEEALKSIEERSPCVVDIIGHTDTIASKKINAEVSLQRAQYIETLIKAKKIKVISMSSKGYGEEDLLVKTADNVAEIKNRNVEIFIK